jgi:hypothetical protein
MVDSEIMLIGDFTSEVEDEVEGRHLSVITGRDEDDGPPKSRPFFSNRVLRLQKTTRLIHPQTLLYSFTASSPNPKNVKKMILEAGIHHQKSIMTPTYWAGTQAIGIAWTRSKLLWT